MSAVLAGRLCEVLKANKRNFELTPRHQVTTVDATGLILFMRVE